MELYQLTSYIKNSSNLGKYKLLLHVFKSSDDTS